MREVSRNGDPTTKVRKMTEILINPVFPDAIDTRAARTHLCHGINELRASRLFGQFLIDFPVKADRPAPHRLASLARDPVDPARWRCEFRNLADDHHRHAQLADGIDRFMQAGQRLRRNFGPARGKNNRVDVLCLDEAKDTRIGSAADEPGQAPIGQNWRASGGSVLEDLGLDPGCRIGEASAIVGGVGIAPEQDFRTVAAGPCALHRVPINHMGPVFVETTRAAPLGI